MSQRDREYSFAERRSFSLGEDAMFAADDERVLLATAGGRIEIVTSADTTTLTIDCTLDAVAVDQYVFTLADGTVRAHTTSGIELWSTSVSTATHTAAFGAGGVLGCVTADGRLVGLDTETGAELYARDRPHSDVSETNAVDAGNGHLAVAEWSFLTVFDESGSVVLEQNLDGAIDDVAVLTDAVVVLLKDGRLTRIGLPSGDVAWSQAVDGRAVAAFGTDDVLVADQSGTNVVDDVGTERSCTLPTVEALRASVDGSLVVTTLEGTQTCYHRGQNASDALDAALLTAAVRTGEPIRFRLANEGDDAVDATVTLATDAVETLQLARQTTDVALEAGETSEVAFRVTEITDSDPVTATLSLDETELVSGTVAPERRIDPSASIETSTTVDRVAGDAVRLDVAATNTGNEATTVELGNDEVVAEIESDDTETLTTTVPREGPDDLSLTVSVGEETSEVSVTVPSVSGEPSLAVEATGTRPDPYVDVELSNPFETTLIGTLSVRADGGGIDIDRAVELGAGTQFRLAIPLTPSFVSDGVELVAGLGEFDVEITETLSPSEWRSDGEAEPATSSGNRRRVPAGNDAEELGRQGATSANESTGRPSPALSVDRTVPDTTRRGERFPERIEITNTGTEVANDVTISVGDTVYEVGQLRPDERTEVERTHAVFETGTFALAEGSVGSARESVTLPTASIHAEPAPVEARVVATVDDDVAVEFHCSNGGDRSCEIDALGVDPAGVDSSAWRLDPTVPLDAGESTVLERRLETWSEPLDEPFKAGIRYQYAGGEQGRYWTLARSQEKMADEQVRDSEDGDSVEQPLTITVETDSLPREDQNSTIECRLEATGSELTDVTVEATGAIVSPLSAGARDIGRIGPGEVRTETIDVVPAASGTAEFDLEVTARGSESPVDTTVNIAGPVIGEEGDTTDGEWAATRIQDRRDGSDGDETVEQRTSGAGDEKPSHLVTTFRE